MYHTPISQGFCAKEIISLVPELMTNPIHTYKLVHRWLVFLTLNREIWSSGTAYVFSSALHDIARPIVSDSGPNPFG